MLDDKCRSYITTFVAIQVIRFMKHITDAEFEIMTVLWSEGPISSGRIAEQLSEKHQWTTQTVRTLLTRLIEKDAVAFTKEGRRHLYFATLKREEFSRSAITRLADRLFGGRAAPLLSEFVADRGMTADDIHDIETLLNALKRDAD